VRRAKKTSVNTAGASPANVSLYRVRRPLLCGACRGDVRAALPLCLHSYREHLHGGADLTPQRAPPTTLRAWRGWLLPIMLLNLLPRRTHGWRHARATATSRTHLPRWTAKAVDASRRHGGWRLHAGRRSGNELNGAAYARTGRVWLPHAHARRARRGRTGGRHLSTAYRLRDIGTILDGTRRRSTTCATHHCRTTLTPPPIFVRWRIPRLYRIHLPHEPTP